MCMKFFSRPFNLLRHMRKMHNESEQTPKMKMEKNGQCQNMTFKTPFTMIVSGATMSGKTSWVKTLLKHKESMISPVPTQILFCYKYWQPSYTDMLQTIPDITFHQGMPNKEDQSGFFDPKRPSLIVFDDLMRTVMNDDNAADLFTEGAHHQNTSIIFIIQNLFFQGKQSRTISVNAHYIVLLKNPRDRSQVEALGRQIYPRKWATFSQTYEKATLQPHGYLVIDLYPTTHESCRLRTNIFPNKQLQRHELFHTMAPVVDSFKKKEYMEPAELHALHESKKKINALMDRYDLPSDIKAHEIGDAQDRYLLFRKRLKSKRSNYSNEKHDTTPPRYSPLLEEPQNTPPELPDLEDSVDIPWDELPDNVFEEEPSQTPLSQPLNEPPQSERTPAMFNFPRTDYDFRRVPGRFISFADDDINTQNV